MLEDWCNIDPKNYVRKGQVNPQQCFDLKSLILAMNAAVRNGQHIRDPSTNIDMSDDTVIALCARHVYNGNDLPYNIGRYVLALMEPDAAAVDVAPQAAVDVAPQAAVDVAPQAAVDVAAQAATYVERSVVPRALASIAARDPELEAMSVYRLSPAEKRILYFINVIQDIDWDYEELVVIYEIRSMQVLIEGDDEINYERVDQLLNDVFDIDADNQVEYVYTILYTLKYLREHP
jgi:hypothetical protein